MRTPTPRRLATAVALLAALLPATVALAAAPAAAVTTDLVAGPPGVTWGATIDGHDVASASGNDPVRLPAGRDVRVDLAVSNDGAKPVTVRNVRLEGRVIGMSFYSFTTQVDLVVQPGETGERSILVDLGELGDQAVGLIPARLSLLAPDRSAVARQSIATDVRGSLISAYGLFGLAVAAITLVTVWVPLVLGCGAVAFVAGYLTPAPREVERDDAAIVDADRYELPGYAGASPRGLDPYAPPALPQPAANPALSQPAPQPSLAEPAPQPGLDEYLPSRVTGPGRHRGHRGQPPAPDVVQLPDSDPDRSYRS
jgi:hypothetical protein